MKQLQAQPQAGKAKLRSSVERHRRLNGMAVAGQADLWQGDCRMDQFMPTLRPALLFAASAAIAVALPAAAQQTPRDQHDILVTGQREAIEADRGEVREQARAVTPRGAISRPRS